MSARLDPIELAERARAIRAVVFDVDGVLTDGRLTYGAEGEVLKNFNVQDGHGMKLLQEAGLTPVIISGRDSPAVARRMRELGISQVHQGVADKRQCFEEVCAALGLKAEEMAAIGDDWPDLPMLARAGLSASVTGGHFSVQIHVHYVTERAGGQGAAREFVELILAAQGRLTGLLARYLD